LKKIALDLAIIAAIAVAIGVFFRGSVTAYAEGLQVEGYSYLIVPIPISLYIVADIIRRYGSPYNLDILRVLSLFGGVLIASAIYAVSRLVVEYALQLEIFSLVILSSSIIFLAYSEFNSFVAPLIAVLSMMLLVPIPWGLINSLSSALLHPIASLAAMLTGAQFTSGEGFVVLTVVDSYGTPRSLQVAPQCSGVVSLMAVLSLAPAVLYIASRSSARFRSKALAVVKALALASATVFVGNVLRIVLVIYTVRVAGLETAMQLFHWTPSIIYVAIATLLALHQVLRLPRPERAPHTNRVVSVESGSVVAKLALIAAAVILFAVASRTLNVGLPTLSVPRIDPAKLVEAPQDVIFNISQLNMQAIPNPRIGAAIGTFALYDMVIREGDRVVYGYIELGESPARFHSWFVCLSAQGYTVEKSWSEVGNTTVTFIVASKDLQRILLTYTVYKYSTELGDIYAKVTLITPLTGEDIGRLVEWMGRTLNEAAPSRIEIATNNLTAVLDIGIALMVIPSVAGLLIRTSKKSRS